MSSRVQTALLALLAVVAAALTVLALRPPDPPDPDSLVTPVAPPSAQASPSALPSTTPSPAAGTSPGASPAATPGRPLTPTDGRERPVVAFAGDSYAAGVGATTPDRNGYVGLLTHRLNWTTRSSGLVGAGYLDAAPGGTVVDAIRALNLAKLKPDLVVLQAGRNDVALPPDQLTARVVEAVALVREQAPAAQVDVVGVLWPAAPPVAATRADAAIRAGAEQAGAMFTHTLDLRFPAPVRNHPDDAGYARISVRLESSFRDLGLLGQ